MACLMPTPSDASTPGGMFGCDDDILQIVGDIDEPIWFDDDFDMIVRPHQILS